MILNQLITILIYGLNSFQPFLVPPKIIDKETSTDIVVKEGSNVTLRCKAKGHPEPYVMWRREDNQEIQYNGVMGKKLPRVDPKFDSHLLIFGFSAQSPKNNFIILPT